MADSLAPLRVMASLPLTAAAATDNIKNYPDRPIRMILPNAPGASVDVLSRIAAARLSEAFGQQVVADNRTGAGGIIGMEIAKAASQGSARPAGD